MTRTHCVFDRACSWFAVRAAWIVCLSVVWMAPCRSWSQSAVWLPQGATTGAISYNGGNVGIGTPSPGYKLDVQGGSTKLWGTSQFPLVLQSGNSGIPFSSVIRFLKYDGSPLWQFGAGALVGNRQEFGLYDDVNAAWRLYVDPSGNVGIGTVAPWDTVHVQGSLRIGSPVYSGNGFTFTQDAAGNLQVQYKTGPTVYSNLMTVNYTGNVGIGTNAPQYLLSVNGTIGAKDVIVTNTGWPDYVFRPGYRLQPLSEINAYIQANHHLPDVPSEAEVKEKGVSVSDMQAKLLAKIEELTLHMIQADEQNKELRERISQLETRAATSEKVLGQ
jgi:hypothetical protein